MLIMSWVLAYNDAGLANSTNRSEWSEKLGMVRLSLFYQSCHWIWCHVSYIWDVFTGVSWKRATKYENKSDDLDVSWIFPLISKELWVSETLLISSESGWEEKCTSWLQFHRASIEPGWWLVFGQQNTNRVKRNRSTQDLFSVVGIMGHHTCSIC